MSGLHAHGARLLEATGRTLGYREVQVMAFVRMTVAARGYAPTYGEIRDALGFSCKRDVRDVVERLERRGLLKRAGRLAIRGRSRRHPILRLVVVNTPLKLESPVLETAAGGGCGHAG